MTICWIAAAVAAFTYSTPLLTIHRAGKKKLKLALFPNTVLNIVFVFLAKITNYLREINLLDMALPYKSKQFVYY